MFSSTPSCRFKPRSVNVLFVPFLANVLYVPLAWFGVVEFAQVLAMVVSGGLAATMLRFKLGCISSKTRCTLCASSVCAVNCL
ncbi:MAG: hypothetical protein U0350_12885 [Caldilineaceae bacterium]